MSVHIKPPKFRLMFPLMHPIAPTIPYYVATVYSAGG